MQAAGHVPHNLNIFIPSIEIRAFIAGLKDLRSLLAQPAPALGRGIACGYGAGLWQAAHAWAATIWAGADK